MSAYLTQIRQFGTLGYILAYKSLFNLEKRQVEITCDVAFKRRDN
jgi:hypothetical protein